MFIKRNAIVRNYLYAALGCLVFGLVYERFSHQVYSPFMLFAFLIPLLGGAGVFALPGLTERETWPGAPARMLYHSALAALTAGSLFRGALDIYGTTSRLGSVYWAGGALLAVSALGLYIMERAEKACRRKN